MSVVTCIDDLRALARRRVPRMFYDYVDSGAWTGITYRENETDFAAIKLRQRVAIDIDRRSLAGTMVGQPVSMPIALAPTGLAGLQRADGEILAARAAAKAGVPFTLSTLSICSLEDVAAASDVPIWFQVYVMRDREFLRRLIERAEAVRCGALVLTLDMQVMGQRHKDLRNGLSASPKLRPGNLLSFAMRPRWCFDMSRTHRRTFGNVVGHAQGVDDPRAAAAWMQRNLDPTLCWDDVRRVRDQWKGKLILKTILDPEDVEPAIATGADALIVSNHGGRQLDGAPSSIRMLPAIVDAAGGRIELHLDSGVRSGQDVLKALALGAQGVYVGRAFVYGLAAMGEAGVTTCLEILRKELDTTMAFCGLRDLRRVDRSILAAPSATR